MDSSECMKKAQEYLEQASQARSEETKAEFLQMAKAWMQLAGEIDAFRDEETIGALKRAN